MSADVLVRDTRSVAPRVLAGPPGAAGRTTRLARLRNDLDTPPGRTRVAGAVLGVLVLLLGVVTAWQIGGRAGAADRLRTDSGPLSQDAAEIYRSLADADTTAAAGLLLAADEPAGVRQRYERDLATASELLARAAARSPASSDAQAWITAMNRNLQLYAGLVETARAANRQGLPLGGAYLRYASALMQDTVLPDAQRLVDSQARRLDADHDEAASVPWAALGLAAAGLGGLARYQVVLFRRTNRVFNLGLAGATVVVLASSVWLVAGVSVASSSLADGRTRGTEPLRALNQARFDALQAHTAENLNLVARGASVVYTRRWDAEVTSLAGGGANGPRGSLVEAAERAPRAAAAELTAARARFEVWQARHREAAEREAAGDYDGALAITVGTGGAETADAAFASLDELLARAAAAEQRVFSDNVRDVGGDLRLLGLGAALSAPVAAWGVVRGIGRRLAEYR